MLRYAPATLTSLYEAANVTIQFYCCIMRAVYQAVNIGYSLIRDRLRLQFIELTIFALTLLEPSGGVATNRSWVSATRADRKDSSLCACPRERRDNSSTSA